MDIASLLHRVTDWAQSEESIRGLLLVGSHARGEAHPDSDVDLVFLTTEPEAYYTTDWMQGIPGMAFESWQDEEYGVVWSRRTFLTSGLEVEFSFAPLEWANTQPVDAGTRQVMQDGHRILYDPDGLLGRLVGELSKPHP